VYVIPPFDSQGRLPPGIHPASWRQIETAFGFTARRKRLLSGLREALVLLKAAGCRLVYLDGSFVTNKVVPGDFDGCWGVDGVNIEKLDPVFLDFHQPTCPAKRPVRRGVFSG
jgi:hypothetical protein